MSMSPDENEALQYSRVSQLGYDLVPTGDDVYPYRVEKHGEIVGRPLRSIDDVAVWVDYQWDEERKAREKFDRDHPDS